jgi:hypothetical protein
MSHDTPPPGRLEQINDRFDRIDARLDRLADNMTTMRDIWIVVFVSAIVWAAAVGLVLWVVI